MLVKCYINVYICMCVIVCSRVKLGGNICKCDCLSWCLSFGCVIQCCRSYPCCPCLLYTHRLSNRWVAGVKISQVSCEMVNKIKPAPKQLMLHSTQHRTYVVEKHVTHLTRVQWARSLVVLTRLIQSTVVRTNNVFFTFFNHSSIKVYFPIFSQISLSFYFNLLLILLFVNDQNTDVGDDIVVSVYVDANLTFQLSVLRQENILFKYLFLSTLYTLR